jgi:hypothetical protein
MHRTRWARTRTRLNIQIYTYNIQHIPQKHDMCPKNTHTYIQPKHTHTYIHTYTYIYTYPRQHIPYVHNIDASLHIAALCLLTHCIQDTYIYTYINIQIYTFAVACSTVTVCENNTKSHSMREHKEQQSEMSSISIRSYINSLTLTFAFRIRKYYKLHIRYTYNICKYTNLNVFYRVIYLDMTYK